MSRSNCFVEVLCVLLVVLLITTGCVGKASNQKASNQHEVKKVGIDEGAKVLFNIEKVSTSFGYFSVEGWGVIKDRDSKNTQYFIVLSSAKKTYFFDTKQDGKRPDVTDYFKKLKDYDDSGYSALIKKDSLEPGVYQVGIYMQQDGVYAQKMSDKYVTIKRFWIF